MFFALNEQYKFNYTNTLESYYSRHSLLVVYQTNNTWITDLNVVEVPDSYVSYNVPRYNDLPYRDHIIQVVL